MIVEKQVGDRTFVLVGTAHVSEESLGEVREAVEKYSPDRICVELDQARYDSMVGESDWGNKDFLEALREGNGYLLFFRTLLSIYQKRLGDELDIGPGSEMIEAIELAEDGDVPFELIDRDINTTFSRAKSSMGLLEKMRMLTSFVEGFFAPSEEVDIESLKDGDMLSEVVEEFSGRFPSLKEVFIDERDEFMAERLLDSDGETVVAVVGAGHVEGILDNLERNFEVRGEDTSDKVGMSLTVSALKYGVPALVIALFAYGFISGGYSTGSRMFGTWFLLNGSFAGLGALFSGSHLLTVLVSFLAAPFTSVNPALPAGLVAVLSENRLRPLRVKDVESMGGITTFAGMWDNRASRLLLIFFFVNLGSALATFLGAGSLASIAGLL